ncbi:MAG: GatB/YqeY domain-containing protein, partial [Bacilli bacterium]|nr:GatB/YqeY domain-containing protein [Bacilli bacterium]
LAEIAILNVYMPTLMSEEEITLFIQKGIEELKPSKNEIGKIMGYVTKELKGKADMALVNKIVKNELEKI